MFRRVVPVLFALSLALPASAQFAGPGTFALLGFSGQHLVFQPMSGATVELGALAPTAQRIRLLGDNLVVVNGDNFGDGTGGGLWIASLDEVRSAAEGDRDVSWNEVDIPDGTNPMDAILAGGKLWVSCQTTGELRVLDPANGYALDTTFTDLANPQGLAFNGTYVLANASGYGFGTTVELFSVDPLEHAASLTVSDNPVEAAVDDNGRFHVACSGRSWGDDPTAGKAAVVDFPLGNPNVQFVDLETHPTSVAHMIGPEDFDPKIVLGDEYAAGDTHIEAYTTVGLTVDTAAHSAGSGGWSLAAGENGIFIGSAQVNTLHFYGYDWGTWTDIITFDEPVAGLVFYDAGLSGVDPDTRITLPETVTLSPAWPNPFNARTTLALTLAQQGEVQVTLFDVLGRRVRELTNGRFAAGDHRVTVDASGLASGVYLVRASTPSGSTVQRITMVR